MLESTGSSKSRDALLEKLRERIKDRDKALEVTHPHTHMDHYNRLCDSWDSHGSLAGKKERSFIRKELSMHFVERASNSNAISLPKHKSA